MNKNVFLNIAERLNEIIFTTTLLMSLNLVLFPFSVLPSLSLRLH
jgi:hypothetical protein